MPRLSAVGISSLQAGEDVNWKDSALPVELEPRIGAGLAGVTPAEQGAGAFALITSGDPCFLLPHA